MLVPRWYQWVFFLVKVINPVCSQFHFYSCKWNHFHSSADIVLPLQYKKVGNSLIMKCFSAVIPAAPAPRSKTFFLSQGAAETIAKLKQRKPSSVCGHLNFLSVAVYQSKKNRVLLYFLTTRSRTCKCSGTQTTIKTTIFIIFFAGRDYQLNGTSYLRARLGREQLFVITRGRSSRCSQTLIKPVSSF